MKAVRCQHTHVQVVDIPPPKGDGVRVKVVSSGICGSDLHMVNGGFGITSTLGHEVAGVLPDGRTVAIEPIAPCGHCDCCARGDYNLCRLGPSMIMGTGLDGGMAEEILVPPRAIVALPSGLPVADACLIEPLAVTLHGLRLAQFNSAQRVAIIGGGTIGQCALAATTEAGANTTLIARHDVQLQAGEQLGASSSRGAEDLGEFDLVIDAAGTVSALDTALQLCKPGGTLLLVATYWEGLELNGFLLSMKEIKIIAASMYSRHGSIRDIDGAAALMARRSAIAKTLITHRFPLDAAIEGFAVAGDRSKAIKVVLEP